MIGAILNAGAIVAGSLAGLVWKRQLPAPAQSLVKVLLGVLTLLCGLWLIWTSLAWPPLKAFQQCLVVLAGLVLGKLAGRLLRFQKISNQIGQFARRRMAEVKPGSPGRFADGFQICAALFCAAPLGIVGAIHDGLSGFYFPLAIKAVMDGLAAMAFVALFGPGVMLSAVPVFVELGTITLCCARFGRPFLAAHLLLGPVNCTGGFLIVCVAVLILEIRKIEVADYLPALFFAPLIAFFFH